MNGGPDKRGIVPSEWHDASTPVSRYRAGKEKKKEKGPHAPRGESSCQREKPIRAWIGQSIIRSLVPSIAGGRRGAAVEVVGFAV